MNSMTQPNYADLVAQAEKAVDAVKNPELKCVAFEKILDGLLTGGSKNARSRARVAKTNARARSVGVASPQARERKRMT